MRWRMHWRDWARWYRSGCGMSEVILRLDVDVGWLD